ncbi:MAG: prepilin-type N-terminal cleavage/methylation domain-containing protein [Erysipelotrichia bacterium]|nr:prepilin-type N-terminal cleavage/methylation domain-containing protein [Erysipelotrichia bacterium]
MIRACVFLRVQTAGGSIFMLRKGFTLIELLVVITILAVLAGAALPYVQSYVEESRIAKAKTDLEEIARAIAVYETREGDYTKTDVSDLTGRYLNKAPIDPWGKPYAIASSSGLVISGGPDRKTGTGFDEDNITAPYQPPLALVQVKWIDKNQSGAVDTQNTPDQVQLYFSRALYASDTMATLNPEPDTASYTDAGTINNILGLSNPASMGAQFDIAATKLLSNGKVMILTVKELDAAKKFVPGSDTITIQTTSDGESTFCDMAGNKTISDQAVKILPQ